MKRVFQGADILLPKKGIDQSHWSVVACDQYTSEPAYWKQVEEIVGQDPSTYHMIFPEVYLEEEGADDRIRKINETMRAYEQDGIYESYPAAMIYVERTDSEGKLRAGIVGCFDLEAYDYHKGSSSLIRATEATVESRIPPRMKIRQHAVVELPHIMILMDDPDRQIIEPLAERKEEMEQLYDYDMMLGGGHNCGYLIPQELQEKILSGIDQLADLKHFAEKYQCPDKPVLLFAMGDGNHSLATAKACYEHLKAEHPGEDLSHHPARYALAELVNLHSPALEFEAIHRIVTGVDRADLLAAMQDKLALSPEEVAGAQRFEIVEQGQSRPVWIGQPSSKLTVGSLQSFLDAYLADHEGKIDYIHGLDVVKNLSMQEHSIGFVLPDMRKSELYPTVISDGALPRKTFSMGHAADKRYYMECRKITE